MTKTKENFVKILLISCFTVNLFVPKAIVNLSVSDALSETIKCQSGILYFASVSTLSIGLLNGLIARELGLPDPQRTPSETKNKKEKNPSNGSSCDYTLVPAQENLLTRTNFFRSINSPLYSVLNISNISREYVLFRSVDFHLHILCLLVMFLFFVLPRGSIDGYALLTTQRQP